MVRRLHDVDVLVYIGFSHSICLFPAEAASISIFTIPFDLSLNTQFGFIFVFSYTQSVRELITEWKTVVLCRVRVYVWGRERGGDAQCMCEFGNTLFDFTTFYWCCVSVIGVCSVHYVADAAPAIFISPSLHWSTIYSYILIARSIHFTFICVHVQSSTATAYVASGKWHCISWVNSNDAITEEDGNANGIIYEGPDDKWIHEVFEMSKNPVNEASVTEKTQRKIKQFPRNNHNVVPLFAHTFLLHYTLSLYLSTITSYLKLQLVSLSDV